MGSNVFDGVPHSVITAYATAENMAQSETTTAVLVWVAVKGTFDGGVISVYDMNGQKLFDGKADGYEFVIPVALEKGNVYFVKVGGRTVKYIF